MEPLIIVDTIGNHLHVLDLGVVLYRIITIGIKASVTLDLILEVSTVRGSTVPHIPSKF